MRLRLWGNPTHFNVVASALRERYGDRLIVLITKRNAGSFTYDGVELGGERVAKEIEETLVDLTHDGYQIRKLSIVGYSLGGLIARYAIGLLHSKGWFDKIKPVNFTTFVTPHLGVRTPLKGYNNHLWNVLGARTLSMSGRQLFGIDSFRDTGRPLLSVLADPNSIFIHALGLFENRCTYSNIINDKSVVYYTTAISAKDPFADLNKVELKYLKGYEDVVLDPNEPVKPRTPDLPPWYSRLAGRAPSFLKNMPVALTLIVLIPLGVVVFLVNSCIQTIRSQRRIRLHENISKEQGYSAYHVPYIIRDVRQAVEDVFENVNAAHSQDYIAEDSEEMAETMAEANLESRESLPAAFQSSDNLLHTPKKEKDNLTNSLQESPQTDFSTLALAPHQFAMIRSLNEVGFRKYAVHIHKDSHSHAAIIVRMPRPSFDEGKIVIKHWINEVFKV